MKVELFPFQKRALDDIRRKTSEAVGSYHRTKTPQVVSFTAPTGSGKTIIMSALIESILYGGEATYGTEIYVEQPNAIIVWLSDSPQLNEQSKLKIDAKADKILLDQCVVVSEDSFDRETFEDGHVYFLNTQKLSVSSKLTKNSDGRTYTIWETIANTVAEKHDRLYFIIDEAHRGMQGREAHKATSIMQKFIKGSERDHIPPMPVVIGMSATPQRFNALVEGTASTIHKAIVTPDEVRASGLLKDRIIITYPEESVLNNDMAILQAAADDWKEKWEHWKQYCNEQHHTRVNPILIVQVLNGTGDNLTDTDLNDCLTKIENRTGFHLGKGQVVHTFGATTAPLTVNGLEVCYEEPSRIADNKKIRVVFFKENLSTGWDCPRAETMMSFKHANDATYIAQLLGRMIRTPMQMHIQVDDVLNDVHLFLPYFNEATVKDIVEELQNSEGGNIPTDIYGQSLTERRFETLTVKPRSKIIPVDPRQMTLDFWGDQPSGEQTPKTPQGETIPAHPDVTTIQPTQQNPVPVTAEQPVVVKTEPTVTPEPQHVVPPVGEKVVQESPVTAPVELTEREKVMGFINEAGLLSYDVRTLRINDYLKSLFRMAHFLSMVNLHREAITLVKDEIVQMIHDHVEGLKSAGKYDDFVQQVKQVKLATQIFDAFGKSVETHLELDLFTTTDTDIDRQFQIAEIKLGREGVGLAYGNKYGDLNDQSGFKVDVILFVADEDCMNSLHSYAESLFHSLNDKYRKYVAKIDSEKIRRDYDCIVSDGDVVSKHNFRLPETIQVPHEVGGKEYKTHLFVSDQTGTAKLRLNGWEAKLIEEEEAREDFVFWIRNPPRASWSLCVPYEINGEIKPTYPDFIIVRKDRFLGYVIDILEPHSADFKDNLGKAKGFAEYAVHNQGIGRIQIIRMVKDAAGKERFKRLDLNKTETRNKVLHIVSNEELDHIFATDGFFDD